MSDKYLQDVPEPGFLGNLTAVVIAAAVGVIVFIFIKNLIDDNISKTEIPRSTQILQPESKIHFKAEREMIIAVDATPTKGGGVCRLQNPNIVCYYSVDWTSHFRFPEHNQEPDKFEMINALLSLKIFEICLQLHSPHPHYDKLTIKTDNTFYKRTRRYRNPDDQNVFENIADLMNKYQGKWREAYQGSDRDMYNANQLSRNAVSFRPKNYDEELYCLKNMSNQAVTVLDEIKDIVPIKYHRHSINKTYSPRTSRLLEESCEEVLKNRTLLFEYNPLVKADQEMIIAVSATPSYGGGVLRLPNHNIIYYYSINWESFFIFSKVSQEQESGKEMINALLSLEIFAERLRTFFPYYNKLTLKTDNIFLKSEDSPILTTRKFL